MADEDTRLEAILEIIPNPPGQAEPYPYHIELTDTRLDSTLEADFTLDLAALEALLVEEDPEPYGAYLFRQVFEESVDEEGRKGRIGERLRQLLQRLETEQREDLVLRLEIARKLAALRSLAWEATLNPLEEQALAADRRLAFYRDVNVDAVQREPIQGQPRVLIAVVSPSEPQMARLNQNLRKKGEIVQDLQALPVEDEKKRLKVLFETLRPGITSTFLEPQANTATCDLLREALEDGEYHVLHLSCHGVISKEEHSVRLVLLDEEGRAVLVKEAEFARVFGKQTSVRLVLLNACHSADASQASGYSGIVPRLLPRVPAVIGMQRQWFTGMPDIEFCRMFYTELSKHGYIDRAIQRARQRLFEKKRQKWVWSTPVLYQHLGKGRLFQPEKRRPAPKATTKITIRPEYYGGPVGIPGKAGAGGRKFPAKHTLKGHKLLEYAGLPGNKDLQDFLRDVGDEIDKEFNETAGEETAPTSPYKKAVLAQEQEKFGKAKQRNALKELLDYYQQQQVKLQARLAEPGAEQARLQEEIEDLAEGMRELQEELGLG